MSISKDTDMKIDRRVKRTHRLLGEALIALTLEKGYDTITIRDITEKADVAYVTFFRHYHDKDELLSKTLETFFQEIESMTHGQDNLAEGRVIFQHVQENANLYRTILSIRGTHKILRRLREDIVEHLAAVCVWLHDENLSVPFEIAANHVAVSALGLIEWWLDHNMAYPPERMAEIYERLMASAMTLVQADMGLKLSE